MAKKLVAKAKEELLEEASKLEPEQTLLYREPKELGCSAWGSPYHGVTRNKEKWQVMITVCQRKCYQGAFESPEEASIVYDKAAICIFGLQAKPNKDYSVWEVLQILNSADQQNFFVRRRKY